MTDRSSGLYAQAIRQFEEFLIDYPDHKFTGPARIALGESRIEQAISGAAPSWSGGLTAVRDFMQGQPRLARILQSRSLAQAAVRRPEDRRWAQQIALETDLDRDLLATSAEAAALFKRIAVDEDKSKVLTEITRAATAAEAAILQHETLQAATENMQAAIERREPMAALDARRKLLDRYPKLSQHKSSKKAAEPTLKLEQELVTEQNEESHGRDCRPASTGRARL